MEKVLEKKSEEWASRQEKDKTDRAMEAGRRRREDIVKWNQMTILRFQTVGKISDIPGLPSGSLGHFMFEDDWGRGD